MSRSRQFLALVALVALAVATQWLQQDGPGTASPAPVASTSGSPALDLPMPVGDDVFSGTVVRISDGDTLVVTVRDAGVDVPHRAGDEVKVRLLRIDTPELQRDDQPLECWAQQAHEALIELTPRGSIVTLQYDVERTDRYGRDLAHAWTSEQTWVNGQLLADGHARVVTFRPNVAHEERVQELEAAARLGRRGLWGACDTG